MLPAEQNKNGRVTRAILATKLDALNDKVDEYRAEVNEWRGDTETRVRALELEQAQQKERWRNTTGILGALQFVGSAIAAAIGLSK